LSCAQELDRRATQPAVHPVVALLEILPEPLESLAELGRTSAQRLRLMSPMKRVMPSSSRASGVRSVKVGGRREGQPMGAQFTAACTRQWANFGCSCSCFIQSGWRPTAAAVATSSRRVSRTKRARTSCLWPGRSCLQPTRNLKVR